MKDKNSNSVGSMQDIANQKNRIEFTEASQASLDGLARMLSNQINGVPNIKNKAISTLESFVQSVSEVAIQLIDVNSTIRFWNQTSELLYGYSPEFAIGKRFDDLLLKDADHSLFTKTLQQAWHNKIPLPVSCWQLTSSKNEKLWVHGNFMPCCTDDKVKELFAIQVSVTADDKFGNLFSPYNEKQGFGELEGHIQQRINELILANEKFQEEILVRAHFEKDLLESEASLKQKVVQQAVELNKTMGDLEQKNQELIQYRNELEVLNEELLETNKAVTIITRNMEKRIEEGKEKTAIEVNPSDCTFFKKS
jgi:PAS domain S-box-containing protein